MHALSPRRKWLVVVTAITVALVAGACGRTKPPQLLSNDPSSPSVAPADPGDQLAALVAALQDKRYVAAYTLRTDRQPDRTVLVSVATDGSARVDVPNAALNGGANVSIVANQDGVYQCLLGGPATNVLPKPGPSSSASPQATASEAATPFYAAPACVKVAAPGTTLPTSADPVVEHIFTDWLSVMTDRNSPILVFSAAQLSGSTGTCFSIEPSSASLAPPMAAGIFCFLADGTLSAAAIAHQKLFLSGTPAPAPPTNPLPGPVIRGPVAPIAAP